MASSELTDLTAVTTLGGDEVLYVVDNPATTPVDRKITATNLATHVAGTLPTLAAATPSELGIATAGGVTTLTLTALIARQVDVAVNAALIGLRLNKIVGDYYSTSYSLPSTSEAGTQDRIVYIPMMLAAGTISEMVIDLVTVQASCTARLGIYGSTNGLPGTLITEFTSGAPLDLSATTGNRTASGTAVIPTAGLYWFAYVSQGAAPAALRVRQANTHTSGLNIPLGTTVPGAGTQTYGCRRGVASGAMAGTAALNTSDSSAQAPWRIQYKYSA